MSHSGPVKYNARLPTLETKRSLCLKRPSPHYPSSDQCRSNIQLSRFYSRFSDLASTVTDRPQLEEIDPTAVAADNNISKDLEPDCSEKENIPPQEDSSVNESSQTGHKKFIDPKEFRPLFKAKPRKNIRKNRKMKATDTPQKEQIGKEKQAKKRQMETKISCANKKGKGVRKVLQDSSTSESDSSMMLEGDGAMTDGFDENSDGDTIPVAKNQLENITRDPVKGECVRVEFQGKKNSLSG
ncbi:hypothetical protein JTB14_028478 [Gonioctena quinquepunctata]|nr:hypothetical protein JTB14_028478 [Gonioctena quinquepunctata]